MRLFNPDGRREEDMRKGRIPKEAAKDTTVQIDTSKDNEENPRPAETEEEKTE